MPNVIKAALPNIDALTNTEPNNFALFVNQAVDYILIKQKATGTVAVTTGAATNIAHGLGYVPMCLAFAEVSSGVWRKLFSSTIDGIGTWIEINSTNLVLRNTTGSTKNFIYFIFYDNIT